LTPFTAAVDIEHGGTELIQLPTELRVRSRPHLFRQSFGLGQDELRIGPVSPIELEQAAGAEQLAEVDLLPGLSEDGFALDEQIAGLGQAAEAELDRAEATENDPLTDPIPDLSRNRQRGFEVLASLVDLAEAEQQFTLVSAVDPF